MFQKKNLESKRKERIGLGYEEDGDDGEFVPRAERHRRLSMGYRPRITASGVVARGAVGWGKLAPSVGIF